MAFACMLRLVLVAALAPAALPAARTPTHHTPSPSEASTQDDAPADRATPLQVIATLPTFGALVTSLGGDLVDVVTICRPGQDTHSIRATPSFMGRVRGAQLLFHSGLDAELWLPALLKGSGNQDLLPGNPRSIDLSEGVTLREVPSVLDRSQGDIHAYGNTHYYTDPFIVRALAERVRDALVLALPEHASEITSRHAAFHQELTQALVGWLTRYKSLRGKSVVVYHRSWVYLLKRFGLEQAGTLEPKPRVAPTASHLDQLIQTMQAREIRVILREPYQDAQAADFVARASGAQVLELSTHPGFPEGVDGIIAHFEHNLAAIAAALEPEDD